MNETPNLWVLHSSCAFAWFVVKMLNLALSAAAAMTPPPVFSAPLSPREVKALELAEEFDKHPVASVNRSIRLKGKKHIMRRPHWFTCDRYHTSRVVSNKTFTDWKAIVHTVKSSAAVNMSALDAHIQCLVREYWKRVGSESTLPMDWTIHHFEPGATETEMTHDHSPDNPKPRSGIFSMIIALTGHGLCFYGRKTRPGRPSTFHLYTMESPGDAIVWTNYHYGDPITNDVSVDSDCVYVLSGNESSTWLHVSYGLVG